MNWTAIAIYVVAAVIVLGLTWKLAKKVFIIAVLLAIAVAVYGVATGALTNASSAKEFVEGAIHNSSEAVGREADNIKEQASSAVQENVKDAVEGIFGD